MKEIRETKTNITCLNLSHLFLAFLFEQRIQTSVPRPIVEDIMYILGTVLPQPHIARLATPKKWGILAAAVLAISPLCSALLHTPCSITTCLVCGPRLIIAAEISGDIYHRVPRTRNSGLNGPHPSDQRTKQQILVTPRHCNYDLLTRLLYLQRHIRGVYFVINQIVSQPGNCLPKLARY